MLRKLLFLSLCIISFSTFGQSTITWNFTGATTGAPSSSAISNLTVSNMSIGNSLGSIAAAISGTSASSGYTGASGTNNIGNAARTGAINTGSNGSAYVEFTLTPASGFTVELTNVSFGVRSTGTGPQAWSLRSSDNSYGNEVAGGTNAASSSWILQTSSTFSKISATGTAITFRIYGYNGAGNPTSGTINWRLDDINLTVNVTSPTNPAISVSPSSTNFGNSAINTPTVSTTYSISGTNLTGAPGNITITPPSSDFQVSTDNSAFSGSINIAYSSATLSSTNFYVRFNPQSSGAKSGNLGFAGGGVSSPPTISVSGTGLAGSELSDIIIASGFTEPENIAYASNQATDATDANSVEVARFTLRDGGSAANDADALSTTLTAISFTVTNHANLRRVALYDGTTELGEVAAAATVNFTGLTLAAADNSSKNFSIRVTFAATVTDRQQFSFTVSSVTADGAGSLFAAANGGAAASSTTGDRNKIQVTATALAFVQQPSNTGPGNNMSPAVTVSANDALGNRDTDFTGNIQITSTGTLTGSPVIVAAVNGLATFSALSHTALGTGFILTARRNPENDRDVTSNAFTIAPIPAAGEIVINQMSPDYNGASDEYVEIVNLTNKTFDLSLVKLSYQASGGGSGSAGGTLSGTLQPYSFWLLSPNASITVGQTSSLARDGAITAGFGTSGQIAIQLVSDNTIIDAAGYGTITGGTFTEGTAAATPPTDGGIKRTIDGNDTNNNSADFSTVTNANIKLRNSNSRIAIASANLPTGTYSNVVVTGNHTLNAAVNVNNQLELVNGTLTTAGNLTLKSASTGTAQVVGGTNASITGNVTVERFLPWSSANNNGFRFVGHPLRSNPVINTVTNLPTASNTVIGYNEAQNAYVGIADRSANWPQGIGYGVWTDAANTLSFTGELQLNDVGPISLTNSSQRWHFMANPFPSVLDWNAVSRTDMANAVYIWEKDNSAEGSGAWGSFVDGVASNNGSRYLAPGQGFMVRANDTGSPSIAFPSAARSTASNPSYYRQHNVVGDVFRVRVTKPANQTGMETVIRFRNQATAAFDVDYDAAFITDFTPASPDMYTTDAQGNKYSIQALPALNTNPVSVPLGLETFGVGAFTFTFDASGMQNQADVRLEDRREGTMTQVIPGQPITISTGLQDTANRFVLHFNGQLSTSVQPSNELAISIYTHEGALYVNGVERGDVRITDLSGRTVYLQANQSFGEAIRPALAKGTYLVQVATSHGNKFVKIIF